MNYYVYRYIRLDTNLPFYVGKGRNKRAKKMANHNQHCKRIANKHGYLIEYILENLTEEDAFNKEIEFIKLYKDLGYCEANYATGGQGPSGIKQSKEHKEKLSIANKGDKNALGYKFTKEQKLNASKNHHLNNGGKPPMLGKLHSKETKEKMRSVGLGKKATNEAKENMRIAALKRWRNK